MTESKRKKKKKNIKKHINNMKVHIYFGEFFKKTPKFLEKFLGKKKTKFLGPKIYFKKGKKGFKPQ